MFDHGGSIAGVEPTLVARFAGNAEHPLPFSLKVRPDVLVRRDDGGVDRGTILEIVEVKTGGSATVDWLQTVAIRRAVGQAYGDSYKQILSTTSFVSVSACRTDNLVPTQPEVQYLSLIHI